MNKEQEEKIIKKGIRHWVMLSDIKTGVNWSMFESGLISDISYLLKAQRDEIIEKIEKKVKRIKLDMDVIICDCGEPYKDSDPADLINELLTYLKTLK